MPGGRKVKQPDRPPVSSRLLILAGALLWVMPQAFAAAAPMATPPSTLNTASTAPAPQATVWIRDPSRVLPLRQTSNVERRKAAVRNAERNRTARGSQAAPAAQGKRP
jgi:hypothetical protein